MTSSRSEEISSDLEEAMTEVRQKLVLQKIKCSVIEKYSNLSVVSALQQTTETPDRCHKILEGTIK